MNKIYRNNLINSINNFPGRIENNKSEGIEFSNILKNKLGKVNERQLEADRLSSAMISGEIDNLHDVMLATEEARLSLELAVQLRNKCVEAFKEVNSMQL